MNNEVAESGQSNAFLPSRAVGVVGSGLAQGDVAARLGVGPGKTPELNSQENLREIVQQELDSEEPSTSVQHPIERMKSVWAKIARYLRWSTLC